MARPRFLLPAVLLSLLSLSVPAAAQTSTWTGASGTGWNNGNNWAPLGVPSATDIALFNTVSFTNGCAITSNSSIAALQFDRGALNFNLTSNSGISLSGLNAITVSATTTGTQTINLANIATGSLLFPSLQNLTITNNMLSSSLGFLAIGPNTVIGTPGNGGVIFTGTGTTVFSGAFSTAGPPDNRVVGGITKSGPGVLVLSGSLANVTGGFTFNGGRLQLLYAANTASKLPSAGALNLTGGELELEPHFSIAVTQAAVGGTVVSAGHTDIRALGTGAALALDLGPLTRSAQGTLNVPSAGMAVRTNTGVTNSLLGAGPAFATFGGTHWAGKSGSNVVAVIGTADIYSPGANTDINVSQGAASGTPNSVRFNNSSLFLGVIGTLTLQSGGILVPTGVTGSVILGGPLDTLTTPGGAGELLVHAYGPLTIDARLVSSGGLTKTGTDTLTLGGANTGLTGPITVNRGHLRVTNVNAVNSTSAINFTDNAARENGAQTLIVELGDGVNGFISRPLRFSAAANGADVFPNLITTVASANSQVDLTGVISSAPGTVTPIRFDGEANDSSRFNLFAANTFTGTVRLENGTLGIVSDANLGNPANRLELATNNFSAGGLEFRTSGIDLTRPVAVLNPGRIVSDRQHVNRISGPLSGGSVFKGGTGTLELTGPNTLSAVFVENGTLRVNAAGLGTAGAIQIRNQGTLSLMETATFAAGRLLFLGSDTGTGLGTVDVAAGTTFTVNGRAVESASSGGVGRLVKTGTGTLVLNDATNSYTGGTTVRSGALHVADDASLGAVSGPVAVEQAGTIRYTATTITSRTFNLAGGQLEAPGVLIFNNSTVNGGFLVVGGTGLFVTQNGSVNTFVGNTTGSATVLHLDATDSLTNFTNNGSITKTSGPTATLTRFTNTSSGRMDLFGAMQVSEFVSNGQIDIAAGGSIQHLGNSNLVLGGGSRTFVGSVANPGGLISLGAGNTIELNGGLLVNNGTINGTVNVNFGSLAKGSGLYGVVNVNQGGVYAPGNSPGISTAAAVSFDSTLTTSGAPTLMMELGGIAPGTGHDQLNVTGPLSLGGKLQVSLINSFAPQLNNSFDILNWNSRSGTFSSIQLPALGSALAWSTHRLYTDGILKVVDINLLPGDFNRDLQVTAADIPAMLKALTDLNAYKIEKGLNDGNLVSIGDLNNSGTLTNRDIQSLLNFLASTGGGSSIQIVPEPSTIVSLAIGFAAFLRFRAQARKRGT